jgi:1-acyl-sn-glycerol-3-phosphate acyltransferase
MRRFLRFLIDQIAFRFLVRIERVEGLDNVPSSGPAILMMNHIAFVDPIVVLGNMPRNVVPLAKEEVYEYRFVGIFPRLWQVIPVRRSEVDRRAIRMALEVLAAGEILLLAPEGTRNPSLRDPKLGVAYLGVRSGVPVLPVAVTGTQGYPTMRRARWREGGAVIRVGPAFRLHAPEGKVTRETLQLMTDESMYVLASMLPAHLRGQYADLSQASTDTLECL